jgi:hypothetical protein
MKIMTITSTAPDEWECVCGNRPRLEGFYPCNEQGEQVEPTPGDWTTDCYVCDRCGAIIDQSTLEIDGQRAGSEKQG